MTPLRISPNVRTLKNQSSSSVASIHVVTFGFGFGRTSSKRTFVSSKNPLIVPQAGRSRAFVQTRWTPWAKGDSAKNLERLCGCLARLVKRSNSSMARITTASLPCLVTTCGARSRALRNTSLNWAFAACNCQRCNDGSKSLPGNSRFFEVLGAISRFLTSQTSLLVGLTALRPLTRGVPKMRVRPGRPKTAF
jgi:hypothetical protein